MICNISIVSKELGNKTVKNVNYIKSNVSPESIKLVIESEDGQAVSLRAISSKYKDLHPILSLVNSLQGHILSKKSFYKIILKVGSKDKKDNYKTPVKITVNRYKTKDFTSKTEPVGSREFKLMVANIIVSD